MLLIRKCNEDVNMKREPSDDDAGAAAAAAAPMAIAFQSTVRGGKREGDEDTT